MSIADIVNTWAGVKEAVETPGEDDDELVEQKREFRLEDGQHLVELRDTSTPIVLFAFCNATCTLGIALNLAGIAPCTKGSATGL